MLQNKKFQTQFKISMDSLRSIQGEEVFALNTLTDGGGKWILVFALIFPLNGSLSFSVSLSLYLYIYKYMYVYGMWVYTCIHA